MKQWLMSSKIGPLYLVASERALHGVYWRPRDVAWLDSLDEDSRDNGEIAKRLSQAQTQIEEFLAAKRTVFTVAIETSGTEFQKRVWSELSRIPYGETCTYADIARRIENPKAVRAVGTANGQNPLSLIVPCHRVIGKDGTLTGYAGGVQIKSALLELERANFRGLQN